MRNSLLLFVAMLWSSSTLASVTVGGPTIGLWWNPNESGRGYQVDIQGNTMLVTTFIYQQSGAPIWYLSSGNYDPSTGTFHSSYDSYSGGQCFGCPWHSPTVHSGDGGDTTIVFHSNVTATLYYPGGSTDIVKFNYGFGSPLEALLGEWSYSFDVAGLMGGDWVVLTGIATDSSGNPYATGFDEGGLGYTAVAAFNQGAFYVVVTQGAYQHAYKMFADDHRGAGNAWVIATGTSVSGSGAPAFSARMLFASEISPAMGAGAAKMTSDSPDQSGLLTSSLGGEVDAQDLAMISRLQAVAETHR